MYRPFLFALLLVASAQLNAQEEPDHKSSRYLLKFSEYQIAASEPQPANEKALLELIQKRKLKPSVTVMLSVVESSEAMVSFGQDVSVVTGMSQRRGADTVYNSVNRQLGTMVKVIVFQKGEELLVELDFESSAPATAMKEDTETTIGKITPRLTTTNVSCTQIVALGKPALLASSTRGTPTYLLLEAEFIKD